MMIAMIEQLKKIIIICHEPLTIRIRSNFYIEEYINAGFNVEYWDLSQAIYPGIKLADQLDVSYVKKINDLDSLKRVLDVEDIVNSIFIVEVNYSWNNRFLFKVLSDKQCYMVRIDMYGNTVLNVPLKSKLAGLSISRIPDILLRQIQQRRFDLFTKRNKVKGYDKIFSSSYLVMNRVPINHPDYESYKRTLEFDSEDKYIVFLDVFFPLHPDLIYMFGYEKISAYCYQQSLTAFFDKMEKRFNLPVVIAAHPKSNYIGTEFGNRKILKGDTVSLVRKAAMVFLHSSNSVSSAILNDKPFELITNNEYNKNGLIKNTLNKLAVVLGKCIYNIDEIDVNTMEVKRMDPQKRAEYINSYLASKETMNTSNVDLLIAEFKKM
ncbi:hypothetical protein [uncultured Parabacteroides sp.]|uniref:hypothetical protein n=2 Tax=Parabacteroides TaxID=375288 RepID=UPI0018996EFA|nr:hypothetical protein [uncultured Parabacteroides sp.]